MAFDGVRWRSMSFLTLDGVVFLGDRLCLIEDFDGLTDETKKLPWTLVVGGLQVRSATAAAAASFAV